MTGGSSRRYKRSGAACGVRRAATTREKENGMASFSDWEETIPAIRL